MSGTFWYNLLIAAGIVVLVFTWYKKRKVADIITFFFATIALTVWCEYFILYLFKGYVYKPGYFTEWYADITIGHIVPNISIWATTSTMVGALSLQRHWIALIAIGYIIIEIFFLKLGIYEHIWWKTYFTGIGAFIFLSVVRIWYDKLSQKQNKFLRSVTFFCAAFNIIQFPTSILLILDKLQYTTGWVEDIYLNTILFTFIYDALIALIYSIFVCILNNKWYWKLLPIVIYLFGDIILVNMNILVFKNGWNLFYLTLVHAVGLMIYILLERYSFIIRRNTNR